MISSAARAAVGTSLVFIALPFTVEITDAVERLPDKNAKFASLPRFEMYARTAMRPAPVTHDGDIADLALRGFSRKQEANADEFGLELVYTNYGHVDEAWRLFERWRDKDDALSGVVSYLSTHPQPDDRIENLERMAAAEGWPSAGDVTPLRWQPTN